MNKTAVLTLAKLLDRIPPETARGFNMGSYFEKVRPGSSYPKRNVKHECGSVACVAGWAALYLRTDGNGLLKKPRSAKDVSRPWAIAASILDLSEHAAIALFLPMNDILAEWGKVSPKQAAKVLRHLAKTGKVDWTVAGIN